MNEPPRGVRKEKPSPYLLLLFDDAENDVRAPKKNKKQKSYYYYSLPTELTHLPSEFIACTPTRTHSHRGNPLHDSPQLHKIDSFARSDNVAVETPRHIECLSPPLHTHTHTPRMDMSGIPATPPCTRSRLPCMLNNACGGSSVAEVPGMPNGRITMWI